MTKQNLDLGDGNFCRNNFEILTYDHLRGHGQNFVEVKPFGRDTRMLAKKSSSSNPTPHFSSPAFTISHLKTCPFLDPSFSLFRSRALKRSSTICIGIRGAVDRIGYARIIVTYLISFTTGG